MLVQQIPLTSLVQTKLNTRKKKTDAEEFDQLKASIAAYGGAIQNLIVIPNGDDFRVIAGSRRLDALNALAKEGTFEPDHKINCYVHDPINGDPTELSLHENLMRSGLHPADQVEAFAKFHRKGKGLTVEQIAERFGISPITVDRRLRLASVHPQLMKLYRDDKINLDCLMAFAVTDDQERQMETYKSIKKANNHVGAHSVKRMMTEEKLTARDRLVHYVKLDKYEAAGGTTTRDLFADEDEDGIYIDDPMILRKLALDKMARQQATLEKKGWKWVKCMLDGSYEEVRKYDQLSSDEEDNWSAEQMAVSGVILAIAYDGRLDAAYGLIAPEDKKEAKQVAKDTGNGVTHKATAATTQPDAAKEIRKEHGLSEALSADLGVIRGSITRWAMLNNYNVAYDLLTYEMARQLLRPLGWSPRERALDMDCKEVHGTLSAALADEEVARNNPGFEIYSATVKRMREKHDRWVSNHSDKEPKDRPSPEIQFALFSDLPEEEKQQIFKLCVALMIPNQLAIDPHRVPEIEQVIDKIKPPFSQFSPNAAAFWSRVPKDHIYGILVDMVDGEYANRHKAMKKADLAGFMERLVSNPADPSFGLSEEAQNRVKAWVPKSFETDTW